MKKKSTATAPPRCAHCTGPVGCQGPCGDIGNILHCDEAALEAVLQKKTSCFFSCSPSDFYEGGRCDMKGCFSTP